MAASGRSRGHARLRVGIETSSRWRSRPAPFGPTRAPPSPPSFEGVLEAGAPSRPQILTGSRARKPPTSIGGGLAATSASCSAECRELGAAGAIELVLGPATAAPPLMNRFPFEKVKPTMMPDLRSDEITR